MHTARRLTTAALTATLLATPLAAVATAQKASHKGWPKIDGKLIINRDDQETPLVGTKDKHNELLGGHGDDTITAGDVGDVIWGDYKPSGQPTTQRDVLTGGPGKDHIYASHGTNTITSGGGADQIHAHFGRGTITCANKKPLIFLSHRSQKKYKLRGCTRITFRSSL